MIERKKYDRLRNRAERIEKRLLRVWRLLHPETELLIVSLPKEDLQERKRILEHIVCVYTGTDFAQYCQDEIAKNQAKRKKKI